MPRSKPSSFLDELLRREYKENSVQLSKKIVNDRLKFAQNLYNKNFLAHFGCVNAVEFLNGGKLLASGGDDRRVLLWNVHESLQGVGSPHAMRAQHVSNIFCLGFDSKNTKLFSAGNDDQVIVHDIQTGDPVDFFLYEQPIYGLSVDPSNDDVFACACDDGSILLYDVRAPSGTEPFVLARSFTAYHGVMYNPVESRLLATANAKDGACLWDSRKPREPLLKYGYPDVVHSCMSVRWNSNGTQILALRRRMPPVLYSVDSPESLVQFDHPGYFNSCTMKSCCFAGYDDEYVLSGSDDFNLYMWKIPTLESKGKWVSSAHIVLGGHRSIVNQVRFNADNFLIASSGVEKLIKIWSPFPLPLSSGGLEKDTSANKRRKVFSHEEYITLVMRSGQVISHDYSQESTKEDPRMMAFFDSLVQREIEGWSSDESLSDDASPAYSDRSVQGSDNNNDGDNDNGNGNGEDNDNLDNGNGGDDSEEDNTVNNSVSNRENENDTNDSSEDLVMKRRKKNKSNPIVKLIAKKRAQLMRLANNKTNNQTVKTNSCCSFNILQNDMNSSSISNNTRSNDSSSSSSRSSSGSSSTASSSKNNSSSSDNSDVSSMSDSTCNSELSNKGGKGKKRKKHLNKSTVNKRKCVIYLSSDSDDEEIGNNDKGEGDDDDDGNEEVDEENNNDNNVSKIDSNDIDRKKKLKREFNSFKIRKLAIKFGNNSSDNITNSSTVTVTNNNRIDNNNENDCDNKEENILSKSNSSTVMQNTPTTSISQLHDDLITSNSSSTSTTPDLHPIKEVENQDSGIFLSDFNNSSDKSNNLKKSLKHSHRNYRKRIIDSDESDA